VNELPGLCFFEFAKARRESKMFAAQLSVLDHVTGLDSLSALEVVCSSGHVRVRVHKNFRDRGFGHDPGSSPRLKKPQVVIAVNHWRRPQASNTQQFRKEFVSTIGFRVNENSSCFILGHKPIR